jgi:superfamily II DNA helicase RecQ
MKSFVKYLHSEDGNVESALVIVPLIALFLATLQLIATVNLRNVEMTSTQNRASSQAIWQEINQNDQAIKLDSGSPFEKLRLLIVKSEREIPRIFPGISSLLGGKKIQVTGTAVIEESEQCWGGYVLC